jgi:MFS family permease
MIESFQIPQADVGKWAGLCSATFALSQAAMGVQWGRFSDRYGRKPAILFGLTTTAISLLVWGFSTSLPMAIAARAFAGAANGNVGILRTTVAELVPYKELQPVAFSIMPLVWNVGSMFGPMLGGALANPLDVKPYERRLTGSLLERYPYALPNIVAVCLFAVGIISGIFFLHETMEAARDRKDYGLIAGRLFTDSCKRMWAKALGKQTKSRIGSEGRSAEEADEPLLGASMTDDEESALDRPVATATKQDPPGWREVLNRQAVINLIAYTMLACHTMAFDQLLPVYLQYNRIGQPNSTPYHGPLKFAGGFGLDHFTIGMISTANGLFSLILQFALFPPVARRYGALRCYKVVACLFPLTYALTPFTALLPSTRAQITCQLGLLFIKDFASVFAFPCSTILLTNSAASMRTLGTLNGIATSTAALGRAAGPAFSGAVFSWGVKSGYIIAPWWLICGFSIVAAAPVFWLVEGEGFGGRPVDDGEDGADEDHCAVDEGYDDAERVRLVDREDQIADLAAVDSTAAAAGEGDPPILPEETLRRI